MTTDRELLELAAKAAGITVNRARTAERDEAGYGHCGLWTTTTTNWNPLTDDGDALRLAVNQMLQVSVYGEEVFAVSFCGKFQIVERVGAAPIAATRRAIVRAAAEIGRRLP